MGLKDLVKKAFLGATDEENKKNKARMREIFNECVANGDDYKLIYCHIQFLSLSLLKKFQNLRSSLKRDYKENF